MFCIIGGVGGRLLVGPHMPVTKRSKFMVRAGLEKLDGAARWGGRKFRWSIAPSR